ncbi:MAG: chorismate-binding protein [Flavobacteriia bacterium]|nr:chorismate-binding protein [Flavobacteriia bacterium]
MSDFIKYRFPGKEKETLCGEFYPLKSIKEYKGFIISSFADDEIFGFNEQKESSLEFSFSEEIPYCVNAREYYMQAHELLNGLNFMQMEKAVFSRVKKVEFSAKNLFYLYEDLCQKYPQSLVYLFSGKKLGTWIGATPEILIESHRQNLFTCAMAGTQKSDENRQWTNKEKTEQEIVKEDIVQCFKELKLNEVECSETYDFLAGPVKHLRTDIAATIPKGLSALEIANFLHPTPAVCGYPYVQALQLIQTVEQQRRRFYTGYLGWVENNYSKLYVNIRCAQSFENSLYLYIGGGYTLESIPELEWIETENKSKTIIHCIRNDYDKR